MNNPNKKERDKGEKVYVCVSEYVRANDNVISRLKTQNGIEQHPNQYKDIQRAIIS